MTPIATYVFMHLETTGLPSLEANRTEITELSMVALQRIHMEPKPSGQLPRVTHKLVLAFNPRQTEISEEAARLSGLNGNLLGGVTPFSKDVCSTIKTFLDCQEKPVCLVAHHGHKFSFQLLKHHFDFWNDWYGGVSLPEDLKCVDSRHCFYELLENRQVLVRFDQERRTSERSLDEVLARPYYNNRVKKYSVKRIYERVLSVTPNARRDYRTAETKSVMIAEIAIARAEEFVKWVDNMYCPFANVVAMPRP